MASSLAALTAGGGGLVSTADASGNLNLVSGTTTIVAVTSAGIAVKGTMSVSGVTTVAAGSAALPAMVSTTGNATTGVWFPAANTVAASTAGVEALRIDSSGNVGIGTSSPTSKLEIKGPAATAGTLSIHDGTGDSPVSGNNAASLLFQARDTSVRTIAEIDVIHTTTNGTGSAMKFLTRVSDVLAERMRIDSSGNVGIGLSSISYQLQVNTDSAGKPGVGGLWTVVSDERIKSDIVPANLDRCYEIVKSVPLKRFGFAPGVYTDDQISDTHNLGWIAQDVQKVFPKAVSTKSFTLKTDISDGVEEYEEQDFTTEMVETTDTRITIINGKPVQVSKVVTSEHKVLLFDTVEVLDEAGVAVMEGETPLTYQMPRMVTKTRPKVRRDVIEDCMDLNSGQMIAALYGAVQSLMSKVDTQAAQIAALNAKVGI